MSSSLIPPTVLFLLGIGHADTGQDTDEPADTADTADTGEATVQPCLCGTFPGTAAMVGVALAATTAARRRRQDAAPSGEHTTRDDIRKALLKKKTLPPDVAQAISEHQDG